MNIVDWLKKEAELVALDRLLEAAAEIERLTAENERLRGLDLVFQSQAEIIGDQDDEIKLLTAENERLSDLSEKLRHSLHVIGADKANPAWTRSLANESAAYQQATP